MPSEEQPEHSIAAAIGSLESILSFARTANLEYRPRREQSCKNEYFLRFHYIPPILGRILGSDFERMCVLGLLVWLPRIPSLCKLQCPLTMLCRSVQLLHTNSSVLHGHLFITNISPSAIHIHFNAPVTDTRAVHKSD